jgi:sugar lactone lactonase YvrE
VNFTFGGAEGNRLFITADTAIWVAALHDGRSLYVTALTSIYRIRTQIPGIRPQ